MKTFEISNQTAKDLQVLQTCVVYMLCDDSGSMDTAIGVGGSTTSSTVDPFAPKGSTRWFELKKAAAAAIQVVTSVNQSGIHLRFLNRMGANFVTDVTSLSSLFQSPPSGRTPLYQALSSIYDEIKQVPDGTNVLICVFSDGEASDCTRSEFESLLWNKRKNVHISFADCTDEEDEMAWLDGFNNRIPNFDNTDDYEEERLKVVRIQGASIPFTYHQYVIKILLATFNRWYFNLDQTKVRQQVPDYLTVMLNGSNSSSRSQQQYTTASSIIPQYQTSSVPNYQPFQAKTNTQSCCLIS